MGLRIPLPWEDDQTPRKVETTIESREVVESVEMRAARRFSDSQLSEADPHRRRRGARGAAAWVHREMARAGIQSSTREVRARVDRARAVTAAKKR